MTDWDDDTPRLRSNLAKVFRRVRDEALQRESLTIEIARGCLWVNSIAMRYGLPPFLRLRPRPDGGYDRAASSAMRGDWRPTVALFRRMYIESLRV